MKKLKYSEELYEDRTNGMNESAEAAINALSEQRSQLSDLEDEDFSPNVKQDMKTDIGNLGLGIYKKKRNTKRKGKGKKRSSRKKR